MDLVRRCCVCKSAIIEGVFVEEGFYDSRMDFTDGILSGECAVRLYGESAVERIELDDPNSFEYRSCSEKAYK